MKFTKFTKSFFFLCRFIQTSCCPKHSNLSVFSRENRAGCEVSTATALHSRGAHGAGSGVKKGFSVGENISNRPLEIDPWKGDSYWKPPFFGFSMLVSRRAKSLANNKRNIRHFLPSDQVMSGDIPWNQSGVPTAEVVVAIPHQLEVALVWDPSKITESQVYIYIYVHNRNATRQQCQNHLW